MSAALTPVAIAALAVLVAAPPVQANDCATLPRPRMRLRLTVTPGHIPEAASIREIVDATWRPEGLSFEWAEGPTGVDPWGGIDVWIAAIPGMPATDHGGLMGEVRFRNGVPRPYIRLSIDAAIAWVQRDQEARFGTSTRSLNQLLGATATLVPRALGYIAAHEIGHFVLGSPEHAKSGLMRATYTGAESLLTGRQPLTLDPGSRARLRSRLAKSSACP